jgi:hypothetical protein
MQAKKKAPPAFVVLPTALSKSRDAQEALRDFSRENQQ